jgi:hypothetical protein
MGLSEKTVPIWLSVSLMAAAFFATIYLSIIYEKQASSLFHENNFKEVFGCYLIFKEYELPITGDFCKRW